MSSVRLTRKMVLRIGNNIRRRRKEVLKLTQEQLAEAGGYEPGYIGEIERAVKQPSLTFVVRIADALQTNVSEILQGIDSDPIRDQARREARRMVRRRIQENLCELQELLEQMAE